MQPPATSTAVKQSLEHLAETGEPLGSGGMEIQEEIARMKEADPAKADRLQTLYSKLERSTNPAEIKATAKAMAAEF